MTTDQISALGAAFGGFGVFLTALGTLLVQARRPTGRDRDTIEAQRHKAAVRESRARARARRAVLDHARASRELLLLASAELADPDPDPDDEAPLEVPEPPAAPGRAPWTSEILRAPSE